MLRIVLVSVFCSALDLDVKLKKALQSNVPLEDSRPFAGGEALWHVLSKFSVNNVVTKEKLEEAYAAMDPAKFRTQEGYSLPPFDAVKHEIDVNKDGDWSKTEILEWQGLWNMYCTSLKDQPYGCVPKCPRGLNGFDGKSNYFDEKKYEKTVLKSISRGKYDSTDDAFYEGTWTKAQRIAYVSLYRTINNVKGGVVQLGMRSNTPWKDLREAMIEDNKLREIKLFDPFAGYNACDHHDTGMCPRNGTSKIVIESVRHEIEKIQGQSAVPSVKEYKFASLPGGALPEQIAFAVIDGELYEDTRTMIRKLWPHLAEGGKMVVHNFGWEGWGGVEKAVDYFAENNKGVKVSTIGSEQGIACYMAVLEKGAEETESVGSIGFWR